MKKLALFLATVTMAAGACTDGVGIEAEAAGRYELRTVNGGALPYTASQSGTLREEITGGAIELDEDGTFTFTLVTRVTAGGSVMTSTESGSGTWNASITQIVLTNADGTTQGGLLVDDRLTIDAQGDGLLLVFEKDD